MAYRMLPQIIGTIDILGSFSPYCEHISAIFINVRDLLVHWLVWFAFKPQPSYLRISLLRVIVCRMFILEL
jgi:hypothetical protein